MATQIKLRRDTAANWLLEDPVLGQGEPGFETNTGKLKIGDGTSLWSALDYIVAEPDGSIDLGAVDKHVLPATDDTYDLGSPAKRWRHVYAADGSIYIGDIKLSNSSGTLIVQQVTNAGLINETPVASPGVVTTDRIINGDHEFSINASGVLQLDGAPYLGGDTVLPSNTLGYLYNDGTGTLTWASGAGGGGGGGSLTVGNGTSASFSNVTEILINGTVTEIEPGLVGISVSGGLSTVTTPAVTGGTYKGLQVSYGMIHSNTDWDELNVNKIVIHKPVNPTVTIDSVANRDDFEVSGIGTSDVLAMFVFYGDVNGAKPLSVLQAFAEYVIDNVILIDGEEDDFRSVNSMKEAFYDNYQFIASAAEGLHTDFRFYLSNVPTLNGGATTVREGSGALFNITNNGNGTYSATVSNGGENYLPGHKIKVLGTDLGGLTPDNDLIITVDSLEDTSINIISTSGTAASTGSTTTWTSPTDFPGYGGGPMGSGCVLTGPGSNTGRINIELTDIDKIAAWQNLASGTQVTVIGTGILGSPLTLDLTGVSGQDGDFYYQEFSTSGALYQDSLSSISSVSFSVAGGTATYNSFAGVNYNVGSGFTVASVTKTGSVSVNSIGSNYVVGDVITLLGANVTGGTTPTNNFTITVDSVDGTGQAYNVTPTGTAPDVWPTKSIDDGGEDQYDTGNYINTNLAEEINYNGGNTVVDGTAAFGAGSTYSFVYDTAIFGLFVRGNSATSLSTSGGSGGDSRSYTKAGFIYDAAVEEQTFDNAVPYINILSEPYTGELVSFTHTDNGTEVDILIADDGEGAGVGITRDENQGIYNPYRDEGWSQSVSPSGTLWNIEGWDNLSNIESRTYDNLYAAFGGNLGNQVVGTECVMYLPDNGKYYTVKFTQWTQGGGGGGFAYTRRELDLDSVEYGIRFGDGTRLTSAENIGRVKLRSPGSRRIEEVHGFNSIAVTERVTGNTITSTANASNSGDTNRIRINAVGTALNNLVVLNGSGSYHDIQVSLDDTNWVTGYIYGTYDGYVEVAFNIQARLPVDINDTVYYRTRIGGQPVRWWDKDDLPAGGSNFRGAVIDYHAYTSSGTVIGTIHIVDDDGEENITHTEVASGGSGTEFIDLWFVDEEGSICYRRTDGAGSTLRIQWTAKVFYGSEIYD